MEILTFFLLVIILIVVITAKSNAKDQSLKIRSDIDELSKQMKLLEAKIKLQPNEPITKVTEKPASPIISTIEKAKETTVKKTDPIIQKPLEPFLQSTDLTKKPELKNEDKIETAPPPSKDEYFHKPKRPTFFERNPDLEKFIGENLISKIGIAILVLAIGFFVKYAIDNDWIGPIGRVAVGIICGGILVGFAHFLRKNYAAFSGVLIGGGIAIFYFTIALAYHEYALFSQPVSFVIMLVITIFAVVLSLLYDRQDTAIIALIGGFAAPFMVSNGSNNYVALFTYLALLNTGLLVIAYQKAWRILNVLAFIFTAILMLSWTALLPENAKANDYKNGLLFATLFYILFFAINIANNIKENKKFIASDFGILLANTGLYFTAGLYFINKMGEAQYQGLFSAAMGIFNLVVTFILMRGKKIDTNILYLLIGVTLTFISITAPLQLHGHFITMFWASEMVLLYWLYRKSNLAILQVSSLIISAAMLLSLLMDWITIYITSTFNYNEPQLILPVIFNKGFLTGIYCAAAVFVLGILYKNPITEKSFGQRVQATMIPILSIAFPVLLFLAGYLEIYYQIWNRLPGLHLQLIYLLLYALSFSFIYLIISKSFLQTKQFANIWLCILTFIYLCCIPASIQLQRNLLSVNNNTMPHFLVHWLSAILFIGIIYLLVKYMKLQGLHKVVGKEASTWILALVIIIFISSEGMMLTNSMFYSLPNNLNILERVYIKAGLPICWGLCSFAFMWVGMKYKYRALRIISLVLFGITLIKLFTYDIQNIPVAGKIAAFFCLGILLLVVSFMYQRLKTIIIKDENETKI